MARTPCIHYPGEIYHVLLRSNGGIEIFTEDQNRQYFESLAAEGVARFGHRIHAYCWMNDHVHLAIQVAHTPLSKIIQNLAFRYARAFFYRKSGGTLIEAAKYFNSGITTLSQQVQYLFNPVPQATMTRAFRKVATQLGFNTTLRA